MKPYVHFIFSLCLVTLLTACEQHYILITQVNSDGSCIRQCQTTTSDTAFLTGEITKNPFPFRLTSEWQLSVYDSVRRSPLPWPLKKEQLTGQSLTVIASKKFPSVRELNDNFHYDHSPWEEIKPYIHLKKSFRWFYTYYSFRETYPQFPAQKIPVPLEMYLTPREQQQWFQSDPSAYTGMNGCEIYEQLNKIQEKVEIWTNHNLFALEYAAIQEIARTVDNPYSSRMSQVRDSIFKLNNNQYAIDTTHIPSLLDQYFRTNYFSGLQRQYHRQLDSLCEQKLELTALLNPQFRYELILPGKIVSSNAPYYENDRLIWKLNAWRFLTEDYVLTAESRQVNLWAILLTFLFVAGIIRKRY